MLGGLDGSLRTGYQRFEYDFRALVVEIVIKTVDGLLHHVPLTADLPTRRLR